MHGVLIASLLLGAGVYGASSVPGRDRSAAARAAFIRTHPCPATASSRGPCPGWVVDHIEPLCAGGADAPSNMQWQQLADAKAKDKDEVRKCAALKRAP